MNENRPLVNTASPTEVELEARARVLGYLTSKLPLQSPEDGTLLVPTCTDDTAVVNCGCAVLIVHAFKNIVCVKRAYCAAHGNREEYVHFVALAEGGIAPLKLEALREVYS